MFEGFFACMSLFTSKESSIFQLTLVFIHIFTLKRRRRSQEEEESTT